MILDHFSNRHLYSSLSDKFKQAFDYLANTDFSQLEMGRHDIDGDNMFVLYQEYDTKEAEGAKSEAHHRYIDVQYMLKGNEQMGVVSKTDQQPVERSEEHDYDLYLTPTTLVPVLEGMFTVFFPDDIHLPGITYLQKEHVVKAVVKIKIKN